MVAAPYKETVLCLKAITTVQNLRTIFCPLFHSLSPLAFSSPIPSQLTKIPYLLKNFRSLEKG